MRTRNELRRSLGHAALLAACMFALAGCGPSRERFTPAPQVAEESLTSALTAWREQRKTDEIEGKPAIRVVDTTRKPGQTLERFEVLSESKITGEGRCYLVKLVFANPAAEIRVRYVVVGIDPVWVFRKEDYDRLAHWEHPMHEAGEDSKASNSDSTPAAPIGASKEERL